MMQIEIIEHRQGGETFGFEQCVALPRVGDNIIIHNCSYMVLKITHEFINHKMDVTTSYKELDGQRYQVIKVFVV